MAHTILDTMIARGNAAARLRKAELEHLRILLAPLSQNSSGSHGLAEAAHETAQGMEVHAGLSGHGDDLNAIGADFAWSPFSFSRGAGLSPGEILDLADQLDIDNIGTPLIFDN